ncbi:MAG: hypothetical protein HYR51_20460 [Candidatus Rokubacteria bacterium]|nr:hypothetical protein [Candidatus Rokubacteria bacterium]
MWIVLCAALALRLLTDLATPFMPGAFMLEESVAAAHRAASVRAIDEVARPATPPRVVAVEIVDTRPPVRWVTAPDPPIAWFPPRQPRRPANPCSDSSEDPLLVTLAVA